MMSPEQVAGQDIDRLLQAAGWAVQDVAQANLHAARGVALRELLLAANVLTTGNGGLSALRAPANFLTRPRQMAELVTDWGDSRLWSAQVRTIRNLAEVDADLERAQALRHASLAKALGG